MKRKKRLRRKEYLALERKKKDRQNKVLTGLFLALVFGGTAATFLVPKREFSDRENRALQQFPKASVDSVLNGEFESDYETYLSDQFPGRDGWIRVKTEAELAMGKDEIKNIYFAKDDYLIESHEGSFTTDTAEKNIGYLAAFLKSQENRFETGRITAMIVSNAVEILKDKLPKYAPDSGESAYLSKIQAAVPASMWFDASSVLAEHKDEYIYYRTDHHWTTLGAWYAYQAWAEAKGFSPAPLSDYTVETLTTDFKGTIESKVGVDVVPDTIQSFMKKDLPAYTLDYNNGQKSSDDLYDRSYLEEKDKYSVFFGGNQPIIRASIKNNSARKLLVIKDSYAHCFLPFTFEDFSEVDFIDIRYFNESLKNYLETSDYTDLLFLYNASGFAEDVSLAKLLS